MQSKTSFFSVAMFRKNISRFYLLAILYTIVQCLALPLNLHMQMRYATSRDFTYDEMMYDAVKTIFQSTQITAAIAVFGACVAAMAVFSYLYNSSSANMMSYLPVRREALFTSAVGSVYAIVILANVVAAILTLVLTIPMGLNLGAWIAQWILIQIAHFTIFFGIAVLSAVITGNIVAMPLIYALINFISIVLSTVVCFLISEISYGINPSNPSIFDQLTPAMELVGSGTIDSPEGVTRTYSNIFYSMTNETIAYFIAGLCLLAVAFFVHKNRRMETAGDVVSVNILKPIFKVIVTICSGFVLTAAIYGTFLWQSDSDTILIACIFPCTFIGHVVADMIVNKRTKIIAKKVLPMALGASVVLTGLAVICDMDVLGYEKKIPDVANIKEVTISADDSFSTTDPEQIAEIIKLHELCIDNKAINEGRNYIHTSYLTVYYELDDGTYVRRYYDDVKYDSSESAKAYFQTLSEILNSVEGIAYRKDINILQTTAFAENGAVRGYNEDISGDSSYYEELSNEDAMELLTECIIPDMKDGTIGLIKIEGAEYDFDFYANRINIDCFVKTSAIMDKEMSSEYPYPTAEKHDSYSGYDACGIFTYPTTKSVRTNAWLEDHGISLVLDSEVVYKD